MEASEHHQDTSTSAVFGAIEDALWRQFGGTSSDSAFCNTWLALQCRIIRGVNAGVVLLGAPEDGRPFGLAASWPEGPQDLQNLAQVAERALGERRGLVLRRKSQAGSDRRPGYDVAYPVQVEGRVRGVVALDLDSRTEEDLRAVMRQLQWGSGWMEVLFHRGRAARESEPQDRLELVVGMLATLVSQKSFHGAAVALVTDLATRFDCDRVSLGLVRHGNVRVEALSHAAEFGKDMNLVRAIAAAMDEAIDQETPVVYPGSSETVGLVHRAHAALAREGGNGAICSIPLPAHGDLVGALTFEREARPDFDGATVSVCESVGALVGPILDVQRREDRWVITKAVDALRTQVAHLVGPAHVGLKLGALGVLALVLFFAFVRGEYRVTADTVVEPAQRQAIVAAFDGYVRTAPLRAGDVVSEAEELATLDDRDLQLERGRLLSQRDQSQRQYQAALGSGNAAEVQIFSAQIAQAEAQVALLDEQIARTHITAPFDGVIVNGDLSQSLGSPVGRGDVLFELAPLDAYRVILQVDERDIPDVAVGQQGQIVLAGFADDPVPFVVRRLTPVSISEEGRNYFRVEAELDEALERLRPGMEGVGKVEIDRRRLAWIWTHEIVDWVRLKAWTWWP